MKGVICCAKRRSCVQPVDDCHVDRRRRRPWCVSKIVGFNAERDLERRGWHGHHADPKQHPITTYGEPHIRRLEPEPNGSTGTLVNVRGTVGGEPCCGSGVLDRERRFVIGKDRTVVVGVSDDHSDLRRVDVAARVPGNHRECVRLAYIRAFVVKHAGG